MGILIKQPLYILKHHRILIDGLDLWNGIQSIDWKNPFSLNIQSSVKHPHTFKFPISYEVVPHYPDRKCRDIRILHLTKPQLHSQPRRGF